MQNNKNNLITSTSLALKINNKKKNLITSTKSLKHKKKKKKLLLLFNDNIKIVIFKIT